MCPDPTEVPTEAATGSAEVPDLRVPRRVAAAGGEGWGGLVDTKRGTLSGSFFCADKGKVIYQSVKLQVHGKTCTKVAALFGGVAGASLADVFGRRPTLMIYLVVSATATAFFAMGAGDPLHGRGLYLAGNFLQGFTKLPFMMKIFDTDCMMQSAQPRVTKMMIDYSRGIMQLIIQLGGLFYLRRWLAGSPGTWSTVWMLLTAILGMLCLQLAWSFRDMGIGGDSSRGASAAVAGAEKPRRGFWATVNSEVAEFVALVRGRPEARAWIVCDCLKTMCSRVAKIEKSLVMLLFNTSYESLTAYASLGPLIASVALPLGPWFLDRVGDQSGYFIMFSTWLGLQALCTVLLPLGWWMVPVKLYAGSCFTGLLVVNCDLLQRMFGRDQAKLQSLAQSGTQLLGLAADYLYLWSFDPEATTLLGQMRPLIIAAVLCVAWWLAVMFHPAWAGPRGQAFSQLEEERQQRLRARSSVASSGERHAKAE